MATALVPRPAADVLSIAREYARALHAARDSNELTSAFITGVLQFPGVDAAEFRPGDNELGLRRALAGIPGLIRSHVVETRAESNGKDWGCVSVWFTGTAPVRRTLAEYLTRELACALNGLGLRLSNAELRNELAAGREEMATRKLVNRASGILAARHRVSESRAESALGAAALRFEFCIRKVAESVVAEDNRALLQFFEQQLS